jgi:hypothetical protein
VAVLDVVTYACTRSAIPIDVEQGRGGLVRGELCTARPGKLARRRVGVDGRT